MYFTEVTSILNNYPQKKLKGKIAQEEIAPFRKKYNNLIPSSPKIAAVLVLLYPIGNQTHFVLIERTKYKGQHSGQISFPGGKKEHEDTNVFDTAIREAWEETNIKKEEIKVVGELSKLYIPHAHFHTAKTTIAPDYANTHT